MRRIALPVLLALLLGCLVSTAAAALDIGKFVPADAVVYVTADGLDPVQGAAGAFLENVMPGAGQIVTGMLLGRVPALSVVDGTRPLALWTLASGSTVVVLPIRDAATFEQLTRPSLGPGDRVTTAGGYGIVTRGAAVDFAALVAGPAAPAPAIRGPVRGFVELGRVLTALGTARPDIAPALGKLEDLPRLDFALSASHERFALNATVPAGAGGFLATLARPALPPVQNRFLDALPADAALVFASSAPERIAAVAEALFGSIDAGVEHRSKRHAQARRMRSQVRMWSTLGRGDSALAVSLPRGLESMSVVQAFSCTRPRRARVLMHKMARHLPRTTSAMPVAVKYVPGAERIGDVVVDQLVIAGAPSPAGTQTPPHAVPSFMREPIRYTFLREAGVTTYGADGLERLRAALSAVGTGVVAPAIAKAIPAGALMAVAVRPAAFLGASGSAGDEYATLAMIPRGTALDLQLVVPAGALPRAPSGVPGVGGPARTPMAMH